LAPSFPLLLSCLFAPSLRSATFLYIHCHEVTRPLNPARGLGRAITSQLGNILAYLEPRRCIWGIYLGSSLPLFLSTEFCLFQLYFIHWIGSLITTVCRMHPLNLPSSYFTVFTWFLACFSFNVIFEFSTG